MNDTIVLPDGDDHSLVSFEDVEPEPSDVADSTGHGTPTQENEEVDLQKTLARRETKAVRSLRILIFMILITVAVLASVGVYLYSKNTEAREFENEFTGQGLKVISGFQGDSFRKLQAMESLSNSITAYTIESGNEFPFVTIPNSARHFEPYLSLTNAASLLVMPIVGPRQRYEWETYSIDNQGWIEQDLVVREDWNQDQRNNGKRALQEDNNTSKPGDLEISRYIKNYVGIDTSPASWIVWWQYAPVIPSRYFVNFNRLALDGFAEEVEAVQRGLAVLSSTWTFEPGLDLQSTRDFTFTQELLQAGGKGSYEPGEPIGYIHYPVFDSYEDDPKTVAVLTATVYWRTYFQNILPDTVSGVVCVIENSLGQKFTYQINGPKAVFLGSDDLHDIRYTDHAISAEYASFTDSNDTRQNGWYTGVPVDTEHISYSIHVYPSSEFEEIYVTNKPILYTAAMIFVFLFTALIFILYDCYVERRQSIVMTTAVKTNAVVSSLFPEAVRDRLMDHAVEQQQAMKSTDRLNSFLSTNQNESEMKSKPIADFFPDTTIMFADIRGFTAWSSVREPAQVFILLESLYSAFDRIANRRRIFKVETIGDCYVAVSGLPEPRKDHAVAMARFANDCLHKVHQLMPELEMELGPGTSDLTMRFGLHSGPVTAGVLRGEKSRFQLFGDTMNTASRMESTSLRDKIQLSEETAALLTAAGKKHWLVKRDELVFAKGKGEMQTYWLHVKSAGGSSTSMVDSASSHSRGSSVDSVGNSTMLDIPDDTNLSENALRLINWNIEILRKLLKQILARRQARTGSTNLSKSVQYKQNTQGTVLDEVTEIIELPDYDAKIVKQQQDPDLMQLSEAVEMQLHDLVISIAVMYRDNPFHNFEHASHVCMSVVKLLSRIIAPSDLQCNDKMLHDCTYGITSDPLTQFACVFSAIIHDVDHPGVPNAQLVKENATIAATYKNKSIAEQNSVDVAWNLLMQDKFKDLRATIYCNEIELERFRHLVVNSVMATDIIDSELKALRNARWDKAFAESKVDEDNINRKATIVIEHLIQASDVAHTMQHWHVFRKWNERLFEEMTLAYQNGHGENDPAEYWYESEIGFFDFYIIPLAKKLKDCGVFGVSSEEYLNYALKNRKEWEERGKEVVNEMVQKIKGIPGSVESQTGPKPENMAFI